MKIKNTTKTSRKAISTKVADVAKTEAETKTVAPVEASAIPAKAAKATKATKTPKAAKQPKAAPAPKAPEPFKNTHKVRLSLADKGIDAFACFNVKTLPADFISAAVPPTGAKMNEDRIIVFNGISNAVKTDGTHYARVHGSGNVTGSLKTLEKIGSLQVFTRQQLDEVLSKGEEVRIVHNKKELTGNIVAETVVARNRYRVFGYRANNKVYLINLEDKANLYNYDHRYSQVRSKGKVAAANSVATAKAS